MAALPFEALTWRGQVGRLRAVASAGLESFGRRALRLSCLGHWENTTYQAELDRDLVPRSALHHPRRLLVRVHRPGYQTAATIRSELDWLESMAAHERLAVPQPLRTRGGEGVVEVVVAGVPEPRLVSVLRWLPGSLLAVKRRGLEDDRRLGETVATLHDQARSWRRPRSFRRRRRDARGMFGVQGGLEDLDSPLALVPKAARGIVRRGLARGWEAITEAERRAGGLLLIHADLHARNVIRHRERLGVIDFDDCGLGPVALDVAIALNDARHGEDWPARREAFIEGHERVAPLDREIVEALDGLFVAGTADWLLWASARAVDNPGFRGKLDEWAGFVVRRLRHLGV